MTRRDEHQLDAASSPTAVEGDNAFLDALARGEDPSNGSDPLAGALLAFRADARGEAEVRPPESARDHSDPGEAQVHSLDGARKHRRRRGMNPWVSGFVGAAAASSLFIGTGAALFNATPGSPLWGPSTALFGDRTAAVELASTLEQIEVARQEGDTENLSSLLEQARSLVELVTPAPSLREERARDRDRTEERTTPERTVTVTVTATPGPSSSEQAPQPEPATAVPAPAPGPETGGPAQPAQPANPAPSQGGQPAVPVQPANPAPSQQGTQQPAPAPVESEWLQPSPAPVEASTPQPAPPPVEVSDSASPGAGAVSRPAPQVVDTHLETGSSI